MKLFFRIIFIIFPFYKASILPKYHKMHPGVHVHDEGGETNNVRIHIQSLPALSLFLALGSVSLV